MVLGWSYHLKLLDELGHDEKVVGKLRPLACAASTGASCGASAGVAFTSFAGVAFAVVVFLVAIMIPF